jgi:hypothetical protein
MGAIFRFLLVRVDCPYICRLLMRMTTKIFAVSLLLTCLLGNRCAAQLTSPAPVDLAYRFHPGEKLHYRWFNETRDPDKPGGYSNHNFDIRKDVFITVESVDSHGNSTLLVHNDESYDWKGGESGTQVASGGLAQDIPLYRITIDPIGRFLGGNIVRRSQQDSDFHEKMKKPDFNGFTPPDTTHIKRSFAQLFPVRPQKEGMHVGTIWHDSVFTPKHSSHYNLGGPRALTASQPPPPTSEGYDAVSTNYSIVQGESGLLDTAFRLITSMKKEEYFGGHLFHWMAEEDQHIRISDGLPSQRTALSSRVGDPEHTKQSVRLISVE